MRVYKGRPGHLQPNVTNVTGQGSTAVRGIAELPSRRFHDTIHSLARGIHSPQYRVARSAARIYCTVRLYRSPRAATRVRSPVCTIQRVRSSRVACGSCYCVYCTASFVNRGVVFLSLDLTISALSLHATWVIDLAESRRWTSDVAVLKNGDYGAAIDVQNERQGARGDYGAAINVQNERQGARIAKPGAASGHEDGKCSHRVRRRAALPPLLLG